MTEEPVQTGRWADQIFHVSPEQWKKTQEELAEALQAQERVAAIVYMCYLDEELEQLLRTVMIEDESVVKQLMKDDRLLGSFSSKLKLAYALGLIPELVRKDLDYLNRIRNAFAHKADIRTFDKAPICDYCRELSTVKLRDGTTRSPRAAHTWAVIENLGYLHLELDWRKKEEALRRGKQMDSVESRYAAYCDIWDTKRNG